MLLRRELLQSLVNGATRDDGIELVKNVREVLLATIWRREMPNILQVAGELFGIRFVQTRTVQPLREQFAVNAGLWKQWPATGR